MPKKITSGIEEQVTQMQFREVYRLVPQKIEMEALKAGDLFFIAPATESDPDVDLNELLIATSDGVVEGIADIMGRRKASVNFEAAKIVNTDKDEDVPVSDLHKHIKDIPEFKKKKKKKKVKKGV